MPSKNSKPTVDTMTNAYSEQRCPLDNITNTKVHNSIKVYFVFKRMFNERKWSHDDVYRFFFVFRKRFFGRRSKSLARRLCRRVARGVPSPLPSATDRNPADERPPPCETGRTRDISRDPKPAPARRVLPPRAYTDRDVSNRPSGAPVRIGDAREPSGFSTDRRRRVRRVTRLTRGRVWTRAKTRHAPSDGRAPTSDRRRAVDVL